MRTYDPEQAMTAQKKFCADHNYPCFCSEICWRCGENIFMPPHGFSVEEAGSRLITGHDYGCHATFLD